MQSDEITLCPECLEWAGIEDGVTECCGAEPVNYDPDVDDER